MSYKYCKRDTGITRKKERFKKQNIKRDSYKKIQSELETERLVSPHEITRRKRKIDKNTDTSRELYVLYVQLVLYNCEVLGTQRETKKEVYTYIEILRELETETKRLKNGNLE